MTPIALGLALALLFSWMWWGSTAPPEQADALDSGLPPCPIAGAPINFAHEFATVAGPIFFCCKRCVEKYEAYPSQYRENLRKQREVLEGLPRVQVTCPVSGDVVTAAVSLEHQGKPVFFCCRKCLSKFQADPDKYLGKLAASYTYQTKCPVSGEAIVPGVSLTMPEGERVHFCSEACRVGFQRDPAKYAGTLAQQGLKLRL